MKLLAAVALVVLSSQVCLAAANKSSADGYSGAITADLPTYQENKDLLKTSPVEFGLITSSTNYTEPGLMKLETKLTGFQVGYSWYDPQDNWKMRVALDYATGKLKYFGGTENLDTGKVTPVDSVGDNQLMDVGMTAGRVLPISATALWVPYSGLKIRQYKTSFGISKDDGGYDRRITYLYLPLGVEGSIVPASGGKFVLRGNAEMDLLLTGKVISYVGQPDKGIHDLSNTQKHGWGAHASVTAEYQFATFRASIQPYVQYWKVGQSDAAVYAEGYTDDGRYVQLEGREPDNKTVMTGVLASVLF